MEKQTHKQFGISPVLWLLTLICSLLFLLLIGKANTQAAPFSCTTGFYQMIGGQLKLLDPETGNYNAVGGTIPGSPNAMGYNPQDGYIYALQTTGTPGNLLRIEHDGSYTSLGVPAGLPGGVYVSGDFDDSGNLWVGNFGALSTLQSIDVSSMTATSLPLSNAMLVSELVFINGYLYGQQGPNSRQINLTNGNVVTSATTGFPDDLPTSAAFGAGWVASDGGLYYSHNISGVIWRIDNYTTSSPTATAIIEADIPTSNDGASCPNAASPLAGPAAANDTASLSGRRILTVSAVNGLLANDTGDSITVTAYTQPSHGTVVIAEDGSYIYTADSRFYGSDTFTYTITDTFGQERTATVTITITTTHNSSNNEEETLAETGSSNQLFIIAACTAIVTGVALLKRYY